MLLPSVPSAGTASAETSAEEQARRGDRRALERLLKQHAHAIGELCRILCGPEAGRDAAQEALERIVVSIGRYDPQKGSFRAWALTVARNVCRDRLRRRGLERRTFEDPGETGAPEAPSEAPDAERIVLARIESARLFEVLETLPTPMRAAIVLFHVHEASYEEIAAALDVPIGTVMTWLHRGRRRLRAALAPEGVAP